MFKSIDEAEKALWPDKCPECGCMAYTGMNEIRCIGVGSCRHYDAKESARWVSLSDELMGTEDTQPQLKLPELSDVQRLQNLAHAPGAAGAAKPAFDWRDYVMNTQPKNPNDLTDWVYSLPAGESKQVMIGDHLQDIYGRDFRVKAIDRTVDKIVIVPWP